MKKTTLSLIVAGALGLAGGAAGWLVWPYGTAALNCTFVPYA